MGKVIMITPPDKHADCTFARAARPVSAILVGETVVAAYVCPECRAVWQTGWALNVLAVEPKRVAAEWSGPGDEPDVEPVYKPRLAALLQDLRRCPECEEVVGAHLAVCSRVDDPAPTLTEAEEAYWRNTRPRSHHHD